MPGNGIYELLAQMKKREQGVRSGAACSMATYQEGKTMPKFIIEREIPGAGDLTPADLQSISQKSCSILGEMGPKIQWVTSYVTDDKLFCIYIAPDEQTVREHAGKGDFPADKVCQVKKIIDPTTAE